jgi:hypothetical protein
MSNTLMNEMRDSDKNDNKNKKVLMRWQVKLQLNDFSCYHLKILKKNIYILDIVNQIISNLIFF